MQQFYFYDGCQYPYRGNRYLERAIGYSNYYQFYQSKNQDLAKFAAEELKRIEDNKRKLNQMRADKKKMSLEQYEDYLEEKEEEERSAIPKIDLTIDK